MLKFDRLVQETLAWKQAGVFKRSWQLFRDDRPVASLRQDRGLLRSDASVYLEGRDEPLFRLRPRGVFKRQIVVESDDERLRAATIRPNLWLTQVDVRFAEGNQYRWTRDNFWNTKWVLQTEDEITIASLERGTLKLNGTFTLLTSDFPNHELTLLLFTGIYSMIRQAQSNSSS